LQTYPYPEKVPDFRIYLIALQSEGVIIPQKNCCSRIIKKLIVLLVFNDTFDNVSGIRLKKNICLFTVTRPTLLSAETLVHFIGKSKVKVDTSEIFGLKKLYM
jgi:hypothetical protein